MFSDAENGLSSTYAPSVAARSTIWHIAWKLCKSRPPPPLSAEQERLARHHRKQLTWRLVSIPFPWPPIELPRSLGRVQLRHMLHRSSFREELTQQAVQVLIRAPLLWAVYICEVHSAPKRPLDALVTAEFKTIIAGDGFHRQTLQRANDGVGTRIRVETAYFVMMQKPVARSLSVSSE